MRTAMRPRYYCDYCSKGNGSPSAMKRHESGCTLNPNRVCGMCRMMVNAKLAEWSPTRDELVRILDTEGFEAMRKSANNCPACILSALRTKNRFSDETGPYVDGPTDGRQLWDYAKAKKEFWHNWMEFQSEQD